MVKEKVWYIEVDRKWFEIKYYLENGRPCLTANGAPVALEPRYNKDIDQLFTLNNKPVRLVVYDNKADIAVDGVFEENHDPVPMREKMHWWSWIFVAANTVVFLFVTGLVPLIIISLGVGGCVGVYKMRGGTASKVITSVVITTAVWSVNIALLLNFVPRPV